MEIIGDDKKLRALFSEAKTADAAAMPGFTSVWHRAQARSLQPRRVFNLSFALVTALLVLTLGSLAVWSMYSPRSNQREAVKNQPAPVGIAPAAVKNPENENNERTAKKVPETPIEVPVQRSFKPRVRRSTSLAGAQTIASSKTKATTIDTWQSPTSALLTSQTDDLFKSVPQLNENANEMKSFLPGRSNDKEK